MRIVAAVVALVAGVHAALWGLSRTETIAPSFDGQFPSVSYAPFNASAKADKGAEASAAQIRADLKILAPYTRSVRTYSATNGVQLVPAIANEFGLRTSVGAWLDNDPKRNAQELRSVVELARRNSNIDAIVVGNETVYRQETILIGDETLSAEEKRLIQEAKAKEAVDPKARAAGHARIIEEEIRVERLVRAIKRVKREVQVPVTTGEVWDIWSKHPNLVSAVDFIAVHILPYWEGKSNVAVVEEAIGAYNKLRQQYPGKRIVIAEFGWPSAGYNLEASQPGRLEQAKVIRDFINRADALGIDYNIVEAFDQPWKVTEGSVGPYWGLFDASRQAKFNWIGPVADRDFWKHAFLAVMIGILLSLPILSLRGATLGQAALLATSAHIVGVWFATLFAYWRGHYFVPGSAFALGFGVTLLVPLIFIALARMEEIAAIVFGRKPRRLLASPPLVPETYAPKVSIHIPAYREPPEMLKATLDAVASLTYPNFECVVIINNTPDPAFWQPIEEHCRHLGERFKFLREDHVEGFKAGALRIALQNTASDAEIIGILDADYIVTPNWLSELVPAFADSKVGLVQAPQDHRDGARTVMHAAMEGEYAGFFDIGMVQRNEKNAIIVHGTMCLIRREALAAAGSWSSDTIVEDSDLGLTLLELGWQAHYTNRRFGYGLLPDSFEAFKKQRHRWAYGGVQLVKKHWRRFLPGVSQLTRDQKREYTLGWLNWLGAETLGVAVAILNLLWVPIVAFVGIAIPDKVLTIPIIAAFVVSLLHFVMLYRLRVSISPRQMLGAVVAAMSVQWTVARAVSDGLVKDHLPFARTAKGGRAKRSLQFQAFWEAVLGGLLVGGAILLVVTNVRQVQEINIFAAVLVLQSLPFLAATAIATLEATPFNDFAYWRLLQQRVLLLSPRRAAAAVAPAIAEVAAIGETAPDTQKEPEAVQ